MASGGRFTLISRSLPARLGNKHAGDLGPVTADYGAGPPWRWERRGSSRSMPLAITAPQTVWARLDDPGNSALQPY